MRTVNSFSRQNVYHLSFGYVFRIYLVKIATHRTSEKERYRWQRISSNFPNVFPIPLVFRSYFNSSNPLLIPSFLSWRTLVCRFFLLTIFPQFAYCKWANTTWEREREREMYENKQFFWRLIDLLKPRSLNVNCFQFVHVCECVRMCANVCVSFFSFHHSA